MKNAEAYRKEYAPKARALIRKMGGKALAAGQNITTIEGAPPKSRVAIQQWESVEKIKAWRDSAEWKERRETGEKYATFRAYAVVGLPRRASTGRRS
ncbi:MAG TPA: DUF1330 domain-containing protein [Burkholderiales bacterium]|nr:DUF1330 domain-containing protein [Burkholderiales bacterium]